MYMLRVEEEPGAADSLNEIAFLSLPNAGSQGRPAHAPQVLL